MRVSDSVNGSWQGVSLKFWSRLYMRLWIQSLRLAFPRVIGWNRTQPIKSTGTIRQFVLSACLHDAKATQSIVEIRPHNPVNEYNGDVITASIGKCGIGP